MSLSTVTPFLLWPLALVGLAVLVLGFMLATPLRRPPPLASIHEGAVAIDRVGLPELSRFSARDGTSLAYRLYPARDGARYQLAILAHGSSASSEEMHAVARALSEAGVAAVAIDARGHGASGTRGDIAYLGQLDDDLADLVAELRKTYPAAKLDLIGHSSGGGFALRIAGRPVGALFDRFVLLAPYLGYSAPTNRPSEGKGRWASPDMPRIVAILALRKLGIDWPQSLPAVAFANAPDAGNFVTREYSFRLLANYGPSPDWKGDFEKAAGRVAVIAGADDELMDVEGYRKALAPLGVPLTILANIDHMGIVHGAPALSAIVATLAAAKPVVSN
jgi:pimeloyl-ACP methyl ester carboxylesterase